MADTMYCHGCHHQWHRESDAIECPACRSASTEIITSDNDPRQFHNRQPQQAAPDASDSTTPAPQPAAAGPAAPSTPSTPEQGGADNAPNNGHGAHNTAQIPFLNMFPGQGGPGLFFVFPPPQVTFFTTIVNHAPHQQQHPQGEATQQGEATHQTDTTRQSEAATPQSETTQPPNPQVAHIAFRMFMRPDSTPAPPPPTGTNSPPAGTQGATEQQTQARQGNGQGPHDAAEAIQAFMTTFLGPMIFTPFTGGDAVYSQEQFDRIITQLREQSGLGGAPPASQTAIDKLEVRVVDEAMLGGGTEAKTRCTICIDEMAVGEKASVLPCSHFFHGECVATWLKQHNTCPICRRAVEEEVKSEKAAFAHEHEHEHAAHQDTTGCL